MFSYEKQKKKEKFLQRGSSFLQIEWFKRWWVGGGLNLPVTFAFGRGVLPLLFNQRGGGRINWQNNYQEEANLPIPPLPFLSPLTQLKTRRKLFHSSILRSRAKPNHHHRHQRRRKVWIYSNKLRHFMCVCEDPNLVCVCVCGESINRNRHVIFPTPSHPPPHPSPSILPRQVLINFQELLSSRREREMY